MYLGSNFKSIYFIEDNEESASDGTSNEEGNNEVNNNEAANSKEESNCVSWRQTLGCNSNGGCDSNRDLSCNVNVPRNASGFCECKNGKKMIKECVDDLQYDTCEDACNGNYLIYGIKYAQSVNQLKIFHYW